MYAIVSLWLDKNQECIGGINVVYNEDIDIILNEIALIGCAGQDQICVGKIHPNNLERFIELYNNVPRAIRPVIGSHDTFIYDLEKLYKQFCELVSVSCDDTNNKLYITYDEVEYE